MKAWIARDKDGSLWLYMVKPRKNADNGMWDDINGVCDFMGLDPSLFPSVKWEDEDPTEVEIIIKPIEK